MSAEYELTVGGTVDIPGHPPVSIDPADSPGVFRVGGNPVRPGPAERSIFEWSDLPGTGLEIRYQDGAHPPGSVLVRQRGDSPRRTVASSRQLRSARGWYGGDDPCCMQPYCPAESDGDKLPQGWGSTTLGRLCPAHTHADHHPHVVMRELIACICGWSAAGPGGLRERRALWLAHAAGEATMRARRQAGQAG